MNTLDFSSMSVRDAAYDTVHSYPGGAMALAVRMGMNGMLLSHKVNPNNVGKYDLTLTEAVRAQQFTENYSIMHTMARDLGHICIQVQETDLQDVNKTVIDTVKEFADFLQASSASLADGNVTDNELRTVDRELSEVVQKCNQLRATLASMNAAVKRAAPVLSVPPRKRV